MSDARELSVNDKDTFVVQQRAARPTQSIAAGSHCFRLLSSLHLCARPFVRLSPSFHVYQSFFCSSYFELSLFPLLATSSSSTELLLCLLSLTS